MDLWPLAWFAPIPWLLLIRREKLDGRRPYLILWLAGFAFWLGALHWLRLPYWATAFGWVALSFYFAFYVPVFIALSRTAVHQFRLPVILAAPIVWTGLELARAHLLTGMTMASLAHTQYRWVQLIQISDLAGAYGVSFLVMFVAACLAHSLENFQIFAKDGKHSFAKEGRHSCLPPQKLGLSPWIALFRPLLPAVAILATVLAYGYARTANNETTPGLKIALIQGSIDTTMDAKEDSRETMFSQDIELSRQAIDKFGKLDLIVWPEGAFQYPLITIDADAGDRDPRLHDDDLTPEKARDNLKSWSDHSSKAIIETAGMLHSPLLIGLDSYHFTADGEQIFNSAVYVSASGDLLGRYDKMHLVMFGEYIPFAHYLTWLYKLTPLTLGTTPGTQPVFFQVRIDATAGSSSIAVKQPGATAGSSSSAVNREIRIAPNICYESVIPHLIRWQINTLTAQGQEPDVLVNFTNDGWFWGSSELDMHLACGVFRAVEFRKPFLIAANTGFSAWIDANGRIVEQGPRRATDVILARVRIDHRKSWYLYYGDWPSGICLAGCCVFAAAGLWKRFQKRMTSYFHTKWG
jgi:apolipoprotein N-acyltransferase